jgi:hypothetical protein
MNIDPKKTTKAKLIAMLKDKVVFPMNITSSTITFGVMTFIENVLEAFLMCKAENGNAWKSGSKLVDITVTAEGYVQYTVKVHGINTQAYFDKLRDKDSNTGIEYDGKKPDFVWFGY